MTTEKETPVATITRIRESKSSAVRTNRKSLFLLVCALLFLAVGVVRGQEPINTTCPVTTDEELGDEAVTVTYQGQIIGLCCKRCRAKFLAAPTKYLANIPQFKKPAAEDEDHHGGGGKASEDHDHSDHGEEGGFIQSIGKFHPIIVHFPIALMIIAALLEALALVKGKKAYGQALRPMLIIGALSSVVAVLLGFAVATGSDQAGELVTVFERHRIAGTTTAVLAVLALFLAEKWRATSNAKLIRFYRAALFSSAVATGIAGHLGGTLIYGLNYFS